MSTAAAAGGGEMAVISRLERLDLILLCLEEIKAGRGGGGSWRRSSDVSTASSGGEGPLTATDGGNSSPEKKKGFRKMEEVVEEMRIKGSLIDRIIFLESRLLKLVENMENEREMETKEMSSPNKRSDRKKHKGLKSLVKSCVKGNLNTKD